MARIYRNFLLLANILAYSSNILPTLAQPPRSVFAHYMLYQDVDIGVYKQEIQLAQSKGIDAFALNSNVWRQNLVDRMYQAAQELGTDFKIFFSADIHKDANGNLSPDILVTMLTDYSSHPNQMQYNGRTLFTSWLGNEDDWWAEFGTNAKDGWNNVFQRAGGKGQFWFIPFFPTDGSTGGVNDMISTWEYEIDGLWAWDTSAWNFSNEQNRNYLSGTNAVGKKFLASVSPWFFTSNSCQVKVDYQGPGLWEAKWKEMVNLNVPLVEIVTWNDWVESSYVAPQISTQGAAAVVTDFPHQAYLELGAYYIKWYKTGNQPAVTANRMFMFYYTNSKNGGGACAAVLSDKLYVTTMLTQAGTLVLNSGSAQQSFSAGVGVSTFSIDFQEGEQRATFNGGTPLVGQQQIKSDGTNFNVYSTYLDF